MPKDVIDDDMLEDDELNQAQDDDHSSEDINEDDEGTGESSESSSSQEDHDEDDDDDSSEAKLEDETDDEAEQRRQRNRNKRHERKLRAREREENYIHSLNMRDQMIAELTHRLNNIERRSQGVDLAQLNGAINQLNQAYLQTQEALRIATEEKNGQGVVQATENLLQIRQRFDQLNQIKQSVQQQTARPQPLDPRLMLHAQTWMDQNRWYKPDGTDNDSRRVRRIDSDLAEEGMLPTSREYWTELTKRVRKELPHRFERGYNGNMTEKTDQLKKRQRVGGSGAESKGGTSRPNKLATLSKERVSAMKEAGIWDNPKARADAIKAYEEFDKAEKQSRSA